MVELRSVQSPRLEAVCYYFPDLEVSVTQAEIQAQRPGRNLLPS